MPTPKANLLDAFIDGNLLTDNGAFVAMRVRPAGTLTLNSGRLLGVDPLKPRDPVPYARSVPPGSHPVLLSFIKFLDRDWQSEHLAFVMIRFREEPPASWEVAQREGQDARLLGPPESYSYPIESGNGAFLDADGLAALTEAGAAVKAVLEGDEGPGKSQADLPLGASGLNAIAFKLGFGDVHHSGWWGLDAAGAPVCLITDLGRLDLARPRLGGDVEARRERIRALIADVRQGEEAARVEMARALGGYGEEATGAIEALIAIVVEEGEKSPFESSLLFASARAIARICEVAPEQVARIADALATPRSEGAALGLLQVASTIRGPHARPLLPVVLSFLRPGHRNEDIYTEALEAVSALAPLAVGVLPLVLEVAGRVEGLPRYIALCAISSLLDAGEPFDPRDVLAAIDPILVDDDTGIQEEQLSLLDRLRPGREATARLAALLEVNDLHIRCDAAERLQKLGAHTARAVDMLLSTLDDAKIEVWRRMDALRVLASYRGQDARAEPALRRFAEAGPKGLSELARESLEGRA